MASKKSPNPRFMKKELAPFAHQKKIELAPFAPKKKIRAKMVTHEHEGTAADVVAGRQERKERQERQRKKEQKKRKKERKKAELAAAKKAAVGVT